MTELPTGVEMDRLRTENAELSDAVDEEIKTRDEYHDLLDTFAYTIAPVDVLGEHSSGNDPWQNALDALTPVAEMEGLAQRETARAVTAEATIERVRAEAQLWLVTRSATLNQAAHDLLAILNAADAPTPVPASTDVTGGAGQ